MRALVSSALLGLCTSGTLVYSSQTPLFNVPVVQSPILDSTFRHFVHALLKDWHSPGGVAVAVVRRDTDNSSDWKVETDGYGFGNPDGSALNADSLFCIASNSKLFTAIATGLLVHNETLSPRVTWKSKLMDLVPQWKLMDSMASAQANIIDLMSHRTGLPRHDQFYGKYTTALDVVQGLKYLRPSAGFRETWQYCNNMYTTLAYIPEALPQVNTPLTDYVTENIFVPLGMQSTTYSFQKANSTDRLATGFGRDAMNRSEDLFGPGIPRAMTYPGWDLPDGNNFEAGAGGVITSANDAAIWLQALLLGGRNPTTNTSVIPPDVIDTVSTGFTVQSGQAHYPELSPEVYGGGQVRLTYRGHQVIEHSGSTNGYKSVISRLPFENIGVAVFSNDEEYGSQLSQIIKYYLLDTLLGLGPIDWSHRLKRDLEAEFQYHQSQVISRPSIPKAPGVGHLELAGNYSHPAYGSLELCIANPMNSPTSASCKALLHEVPVLLPGVLENITHCGIPALISRWHGFWASHIVLTHFDGNVFNLTILESRNTVGWTDTPFWVGDLSQGAIFTAEFDIGMAEETNVVQGLGFMGDFWGAGAGVTAPGGASVAERSEVWYTRLDSDKSPMR